MGKISSVHRWLSCARKKQMDGKRVLKWFSSALRVPVIFNKSGIHTSKPTRWFGTHDDEFTASMTTRSLPFLLPLWWTYISSRHVSFVIPNVGEFNVRIVVVGSKRKCKKWPVQIQNIQTIYANWTLFPSVRQLVSQLHTVWIQWTDYKRLCAIAVIAASHSQTIWNLFDFFLLLLFCFVCFSFFVKQTNKFDK